MITREFKVNKREFMSKKNTVIKQKTIATMKAYTLKGFSLDEKNNVATCKVNIKKQGAIVQLPSTYFIYYYTEQIPDNESEIKLNLHISTVSLDAS